MLGSEAAAPDPTLDAMTQAALTGVSRAFASVGRAFVCLDPRFRVVHASHVVDDILGEGASLSVRGLPVESILGEDLFGTSGSLREALLRGERREGWRATLRCGEAGPRLVSLTAAKLEHDDTGICDPRIAYLLVMRPAGGEEINEAAPTFFSGIIARAPEMLRVLQLVENLEHSEATVLLTGESGVGKEVVARAIHRHSTRRQGPFVAVNCAALPGDLLESELFGHARGSFTGAVKDRVGRFELASEGTLFLDEIGDLPPGLQVKLLRVLQERTFERVGENRSRQTAARIVAATNADLREGVARGTFREDLYYRLRVVPVEVPPLRRRRQDIRPLADHLLARTAAQQGLVKRLSPQAVRALLAYDWPGNVRELVNALEYAVAVGKSETILPEDLPPEILSRTAPESTPIPAGPAATETSGEPERERLVQALNEHAWKREAAAASLGISRTTLWRKMREHRLA